MLIVQTRPLFGAHARRELAESMNRLSESRGKGMTATYPEAIPVTLAAGGEKVSRNNRDPVAIQCVGGKFEGIKARFKFYPQQEAAAWP